MNPMKQLHASIASKCPEAQLSLDLSDRPDGRSWLDVALGGQQLAIEWTGALGFGITSPSGDELGEGPDEVYGDLASARERVLSLLKRGGKTVPPRPVMLRRLREIRNLSQVELAKSLNVSQATVSKMERRSDMYISTLRKLLQAIGGDLEITARFPGYAVRISQFEELDRPEQPEKQGQKPKSRSGTPAADTVRARSGRQRH